MLLLSVWLRVMLCRAVLFELCLGYGAQICAVPCRLRSHLCCAVCAAMRCDAVFLYLYGAVLCWPAVLCHVQCALRYAVIKSWFAQQMYQTNQTILVQCPRSFSED